MPGIVGLITTMPRRVAEAQLQRMVASLCHESFYVSGIWIDESLGVYVGWIARKGSFSDVMPLYGQRDDEVLIFSGEEFPDPRRVSRLKEHKHNVRDKASYLIYLADEYPTFLAELNGRFHGLLAKRKDGTATLFNDRYGMHRIYYHDSKEAFYFAAEVKAILGVRPELRTADARGLGEFINCGCVLENRTIFKGIYVLPPAAAWTFQNAKVKRKSNYFNPDDWERQAPLDAESYYKEISEVFSQNLPRYFNGQERVGMSLTGGLDTRMIMAWHKPDPGSLPCYSFGGMFRDCQDVVLARKVATTCGQPYQVIPVAQEFLSNFSHYAERTVYLTDGCVDVSHSPDLYVNERAARIAPVRMTGNYGGEVLRRVRAFKPASLSSGLLNADFLPQMDLAAKTYTAMTQAHPLTFALFKQAPWHHYGLLALEQTQLSLRSPFLDNDFVRTVYRAPASALTNSDISLRLIADGNPVLGKIRTDRGLAAINGHVHSRLLHEYLEFTFKAEYAYDYGMPQWVARIDHAFSRLHFERLFLGRHKFYHFRIWYRDFLASYVREILLDPRTLSRPYLQRKGVERIVRDHLQEGKNYTTEIHKLLTLELVHRLFLDY